MISCLFFDPGQNERQRQRYDGGVHMGAFAQLAVGIQVGGLLKIYGKTAAAGIDDTILQRGVIYMQPLLELPDDLGAFLVRPIVRTMHRSISPSSTLNLGALFHPPP